jgi:hypothetical protein
VLLQALRAAAGDLEHPHDDGGAGVSAETPAAPAAPAGEPAGPAISVSTAQMLTCTATMSRKNGKINGTSRTSPRCSGPRPGWWN